MLCDNLKLPQITKTSNFIAIVFRRVNWKDWLEINDEKGSKVFQFERSPVIVFFTIYLKTRGGLDGVSLTFLLNVTLYWINKEKMATDRNIYTRSNCHSLIAEVNWGFRNVRVKCQRRHILGRVHGLKVQPGVDRGVKHSHRS